MYNYIQDAFYSTIWIGGHVGCLPMNNCRMRFFYFFSTLYALALLFQFLWNAVLARPHLTRRCIKCRIDLQMTDTNISLRDSIIAHSQSLHITMQMSRPSCFRIYWNTHHHFSLLSFKSIFLDCMFVYICTKCLHIFCNTPKGYLNIDLVRIILNMPTGTKSHFICIFFFTKVLWVVQEKLFKIKKNIFVFLLHI